MKRFTGEQNRGSLPRQNQIGKIPKSHVGSGFKDRPLSFADMTSQAKNYKAPVSKRGVTPSVARDMNTFMNGHVSGFRGQLNGGSDQLTLSPLMSKESKAKGYSESRFQGIEKAGSRQEADDLTSLKAKTMSQLQNHAQKESFSVKDLLGSFGLPNNEQKIMKRAQAIAGEDASPQKMQRAMMQAVAEERAKAFAKKQAANAAKLGVKAIGKAGACLVENPHVALGLASGVAAYYAGKGLTNALHHGAIFNDLAYWAGDKTKDLIRAGLEWANDKLVPGTAKLSDFANAYHQGVNFYHMQHGTSSIGNAVGSTYYGVRGVFRQGLRAMGVEPGSKGLIGHAFSGIKSLTKWAVHGAKHLFTMIQSASVVAKTALATSLGGVTVLAATTGGIGIMSYLDKKRIEDACVPKFTKFNMKALSTVNPGDLSGEQLEVVQQIFSVLHEFGFTNAWVAGILGNFEHESGLDPTQIIGFSGIEPFTIGPKKQAVIDRGFTNGSDTGDGAGVSHVGIGLGQWTNERNVSLRAYADDHGMPWYTVGAQLGYMFSGNPSERLDVLEDMRDNKGASIDEATTQFLTRWEGINDGTGGIRIEHAKKWAIVIEDMKPDSAYAQGILSMANIKRSGSNAIGSQAKKDNGCGKPIGDLVCGSDGMPGTGLPPEGGGFAWKPNEVPDELKPYIHDPAKAGLEYSGSGGWFENSGQCVDLTTSLMHLWYGDACPLAAYGNGNVTAHNMAERNGGSMTTTPSEGAAWSTPGPTGAGHTGVVSHVFENGDFLIIEQNFLGYSGVNSGMVDTWNYRLIKKERIAADGYEFWKPSQAPAWGGLSGGKTAAGTPSEQCLVQGEVLNAEGKKILEEARKYLGKPYVYGGTNPNTGADCSGFVKYVLEQIGFKNVSRTAADQGRSLGKQIDVSDAHPGDLLVWDTGAGGRGDHIGFYAGNGKMIHAMNESEGIVENSCDSVYVVMGEPSYAVRITK